MQTQALSILCIAVLLLPNACGRADTISGVSANTVSATGQDYTLTVPEYSKIAESNLPQTTDTFVAQNEAAGRNLLQQYRSGKLSNAQKSELIFLLGEMRAFGATDDLIKDINFLDRHPQGFTYQIRGGYAAQKALASIGKYSFDEIMEVMSDRKKEVPFVVPNVEAYAWVLWAIEGKHCALYKLQTRLATQTSPKVRSQYSMVIRQLRKYPTED